MIFDTLAGAQWDYETGAAGVVTVPSGYVVTGIACHASGAGASIAIAPNGAGQKPAVGAPPLPQRGAMPLPPVSWFSLKLLGEIGAGSTITFTATDAFLVTYAKLQSGAAH